MTHWLNRALTMTLVCALALFATAGMAQDIDGGGLVVTLDDAGGTDGATWSATFAGDTVVKGGYFSITELFSQTGGTDFVNDGAHSADWAATATGTYADGPLLGTYETSVAQYDDPAFSSQLIHQYSFGDPAAGSAYVILVFKVEHTWTGGAFPDLIPSLWMDLDANGAANAANNDCATVTTAGGQPVYYAYDSVAGAPNSWVGVTLLTEAASNVDFVTAFPADDAAEVALVDTAAGVDGDTGTPDDYVVSVSGQAQSNMAAIGDSFTIAFAIVAGTSQANMETAADAAVDAWGTDAAIAGWTGGTISDAIAGTQNPGTFTVANVESGFPGPVIDAMDITTGSVCGGDTITVDGILLSGLTGMSFGGGTTVAPEAGGTDFQFTLVTPASAAATVDLEFISATGATELTGAFEFELNAANAPTLTDFSPTSGDDTGGETITLTGTNFDCDTPIVRFGSSIAAIQGTPTATEIIVAAPAGTAGDVDISVTTNEGTATLGSYTYDSTSSGSGSSADDAALLTGKSACVLDTHNQWPLIFVLLAIGAFALRILTVRHRQA